jgi:hypothetical protein
MKALLLLVFLSLCISLQEAAACVNSSLTLDNFQPSGSNFDITVTLCMGGGQGGATDDTDNFFFSFFKNGGITVPAYTPNVTSQIGVQYDAYDLGPGTYPAGDGTIMYTDNCFIPVCGPFECITNGGCGSAHTTCRQFIFTVSTTPDSMRVFGIEGNGDPQAGCYPDADMLITSFSILPVELESFIARPDGETVQLDWRTAQELNSEDFVVMRSNDGRTFYDIATLPACGNCSAASDYSFRDISARPGVNYYRLLMRDFDGSQTLSPIVSVEMPYAVPVRIFPNPMSQGQEFLHIAIDDGLETEAIFLSVFNLLGEAVFTKNVDVQGSGNITVQLDRPLSPGVYFVSGSAAQPLFHERLVVR